MIYFRYTIVNICMKTIIIKIINSVTSAIIIICPVILSNYSFIREDRRK
jgi:hypothetical protein